MTIKTLVNQKPNKNDETHSQDNNPNQNLVGTNGRNTHRNVLNQIGGQDSQSPQREKRVLAGARRQQQKSKLKRGERDKVNKGQLLQLVVSSNKSSPGHQIQNHVTPSNLPVGCQVVPNNSGCLLNTNNGPIEETFSGYNSGDEHISQRDAMLSPEEWNNRDVNFIKAISERGLIVKEIVEDGACLFRAISLQVYGDQDMHEVIRQQTMDYIFQNREYYAQFVTEDITKYVSRKRLSSVHGNHIEIQAMSEMYNRPVELYCYEMEPINIFNSEQISTGYEPLRLSYQRCSHYNAIINPYKASVGVGLGLAGYRPDEFEHKQFKDAVQMSEEQEIEQTMFEDKLKTTDWEATNEAIEEQIARESYLQWCRENLKDAESNLRGGTSSSTVTSATASSTNTTISNNTNSNNNINNNNNSIGTSQLTDQLLNLDSSYHYRIDDNNKNSDHESGSSQSCGNNNNNKDNYRRNFREYLGSSAIITKTRRRLRTAEMVGSTGMASTIPLKKRKNRYTLHEHQQQSPSPVVDNEDNNNNNNNKERVCGVTMGSIVPIPTEQLLAPSTSSQIENNPKHEPFSIFYQSLLESSYSDDGVDQLTEHEMIQKALQMSRIDFINKSNDKTSSRYIDEEYDSSP